METGAGSGVRWTGSRVSHPKPTRRRQHRLLSLATRAGPGQEQLGRLGKALEHHLADQLELDAVLAAGEIHDRARDEHLAAGGPRDHARRPVDLATVVVAVAIQRRP